MVMCSSNVVIVEPLLLLEFLPFHEFGAEAVWKSARAKAMPFDGRHSIILNLENEKQL